MYSLTLVCLIVSADLGGLLGLYLGGSAISVFEIIDFIVYYVLLHLRHNSNHRKDKHLQNTTSQAKSHMVEKPSDIASIKQSVSGGFQNVAVRHRFTEGNRNSNGNIKKVANIQYGHFNDIISHIGVINTANDIMSNENCIRDDDVMNFTNRRISQRSSREENRLSNNNINRIGSSDNHRILLSNCISRVGLGYNMSNQQTSDDNNSYRLQSNELAFSQQDDFVVSTSL